MYAQVVESELVTNWNKLQPVIRADHSTIVTPEEVEQCAGAAAVHDLQLDQLSTESFQPLTNPLLVFRYQQYKLD